MINPANLAAHRVRDTQMQLEEQDKRTDAQSVQARQFGPTLAGDVTPTQLSFYATALHVHTGGKFIWVMALNDGVVAQPTRWETRAEAETYLSKYRDKRVAENAGRI